MSMRKPLAIFISALMASSAANAAEVYNKDSNKLDFYGKVVGLNYISNNKAEHGDKSYARFGFKGVTKISDQLSGYGQWEYNVKTNNPEAMDMGNATRLAFVGLKFADFGSFDYGRNNGVLYDVSSFTDVNPEFGGDSFTKEDNFMTGRAKGLATFRTSNFFGSIDGLSLALQYQGKNPNPHKSEDRRDGNGEGWGASTSYDLGYGIQLAGAYASSNRTDIQASDKNGQTADAWNLGMKYDNAQLYLAAMYAETRNMSHYGISNNRYAKKTQNIEIAAHYLFVDGPAEGLQPSLAYVQSVGKKLDPVSKSGDAADAAASFKGGKQDLVKYIEVGTSYFFNKNMYTYVDYKINLLKKDTYTSATGVNTDNILGLGLVYQF
ncbi:porin [Serratia sp. M24T3]|uniref:porin n=1 Tax=Serratia sp. M24T3 TaxID=932213 RepID=UPI00025BB90C|nr:porin [Serratia sp. M24T3]EIC85754.1 putative outer membrane porin F protein [Serratia sp. M24T3]